MSLEGIRERRRGKGWKRVDKRGGAYPEAVQGADEGEICD